MIYILNQSGLAAARFWYYLGRCVRISQLKIEDIIIAQYICSANIALVPFRYSLFLFVSSKLICFCRWGWKSLSLDIDQPSLVNGRVQEPQTNWYDAIAIDYPRQGTSSIITWAFVLSVRSALGNRFLVKFYIEIVYFKSYIFQGISAAVKNFRKFIFFYKKFEKTHSKLRQNRKTSKENCSYVIWPIKTWHSGVFWDRWSLMTW